MLVLVVLQPLVEVKCYDRRKNMSRLFTEPAYIRGGLSTGMAIADKQRELAKQRGLASGFTKVLNGDNTGWQEMANADPVKTMDAWNTQKKLEQSKTGGAWTSDLGRMWSIANDPNQTQENRQLATQYLQYMARNPLANQGWNYAGRIGTLQADLGLGGQVEAEKTLAREEAKNNAEISKKESNLKRSMPSFYEMADELIDLADKATYTKAGRVRDSLLRELDRPMSEGGIAREKYDEIVKNELLPKLRETFGGQLSDSEREALLGTLGNVNLSPAEKKQAVRAFIEAKERQLRSYGSETAKQDDPLGIL
jgi:hypothetical protein